MRTIHKFEIVQGRFQLPLPEQYLILHVAVQGNTPFIWIELDTDDTKQINTFCVVGTGWALVSDIREEHAFHVGTYIQGPWVWHLYLIKKDW